MIFSSQFFLLFFTFFLLTGCARTSTLYSNTFVKPTKTITNIKVLYLENKLIGKSGETSDSSLTSMGYNDLPELLRERATLVLKMNGITSEYTTIQHVNFGQKEAINSIQWAKNTNTSTPLLILQVVDGTITSYQGNTTYDLNMHANLFDSSTQTRLWTGQFKNRLTKTLLVHVGFDNEFVDKMIKSILEQMAKDGFIQLNDNKVLLPESIKELTPHLDIVKQKIPHPS